MYSKECVSTENNPKWWVGSDRIVIVSLAFVSPMYPVHSAIHPLPITHDQLAKPLCAKTVKLDSISSRTCLVFWNLSVQTRSKDPHGLLGIFTTISIVCSGFVFPRLNSGASTVDRRDNRLILDE